MRPFNPAQDWRRPVCRALRRLRRDERGHTALEFSLVALPFFLFTFGIMGTGLHFFTTSTLEHAAEAASRKLRTGEAQQNGKTIADFKEMVCQEAGTFIDCTKLNVHVQNAEEWKDLVPVECETAPNDPFSGTLTPPTGTPTDPISSSSGGANARVMVTLCYEWDFAQKVPFLRMGDLGNGSALLQASTAFQVEPYE